MTSHALQFTLLTAARTSETLGATSDEIDIDKRLWRVPAERMKARKPHEVPLSEQACILLEAVMRSHNARHISRTKSGKTVIEHGDAYLS